MDVRNLDLNLIPVLDALLRHRSATQAARELDMSQPALSTALGRLRHALGDELFVRTGRGLRPTERAASLAEPVSEILERVRDRILSAPSFDPAKSDQAFRLAHTDVGAYVLWPRIVSAVRSEAPHVRLSLSVFNRIALPNALAEGRVDLAVGSFPNLPSSLFQRRLYDRHYVALLRASHPWKKLHMSMADFAGMPQIVVRADSGIQDTISHLLAEHQLNRRDTLEMPSYLLIPPLLASGDFIAVVPGQLADVFMQRGGLRTIPLPFDLPPSTIRMHWHRRCQDDAASQWLRDLIVRVLT